MPLGEGTTRGLGGRVRNGRAWIFVLAALGAGTAHSYMDTAARVDRGETLVPRPEQARLSALGFDALVADYYWLLAVQLVGGEQAGAGGSDALLASLLDVTTTLDPWVGHPYRFAGVWLTQSEESVRAGNRLLERGVAYHPRDWRNRHYLGFNHFFYLGDAQRAASTIEGAVGLPGAPPYLGGLVAKLRLDGGGLEAAAVFLAELARATDDEYARAEYLKALDEIEIERRARDLDAARREYRRRFGRDLERVEDLARGPDPVLQEIPPAHLHFEGFHWEVDAATDQIVSSFYGKRYDLHSHPSDVERRRSWGVEGGGA
jgi:hypothetical protein